MNVFALFLLKNIQTRTYLGSIACLNSVKNTTKCNITDIVSTSSSCGSNQALIRPAARQSRSRLGKEDGRLCCKVNAKCFPNPENTRFESQTKMRRSRAEQVGVMRFFGQYLQMKTKTDIECAVNDLEVIIPQYGLVFANEETYRAVRSP
jgi:hypothetical protein